MSNPTPQMVHINQVLTDLSVGYIQDAGDFVADKVFPNIPVDKQSNLFTIYPKGQWFRSDAKVRGPGEESAGSGYPITQDQYLCVVKALHKDIDKQTRSNEDPPIDSDADATLFLTQQMLLGRDKDFAAKYFKEGIWTGSSTGADIAPATKWDVADSTPIKDMRTEIIAGRRKNGRPFNSLLLSDGVWAALQDNADFLSRISYNVTRMVSTQLLAQILELQNVWVARAVENVADEGLEPDMAPVFGDYALLCHVAPNPGRFQPSAGYTFSWRGYTGTDQGIGIATFPMAHLKSDRVEAEMAYDMKLVASDLGCLFKTLIG